LLFCSWYFTPLAFHSFYTRAKVSFVTDEFYHCNCCIHFWSQASYRYTILWVAFLDPSDSYFLFADFVDFYTHWTYMLIFRHIFLSNYWWQKSDIWSQASYRYPISWEAFLDPSDSYYWHYELFGKHFGLLKLWVQIPLMERCTPYSIMW
jgi:hypothetical protein